VPSSVPRGLPPLSAALPVKRLARTLFPKPVWRWLGREIRDLPFRWRDLGPDLCQRWSRRDVPLPPARLRRRVGLTSSREEFLAVGDAMARAVLDAFEECRRSDQSYRSWLDFGCGSGRLARFLGGSGERDLHGVDVDRAAIGWARRHLGAGFVATSIQPPLPFAAGRFDVVCAISVFTHLDEAMQHSWLRELRRVLRPGGLLIASTHHEDLQWTRPDLTDEKRAQLAAAGFLFAPGNGRFNDNSTFHTLPYLLEQWGGLFTLGLYTRHGLGGYQDLAVWEAKRPKSCAKDRGRTSRSEVASDTVPCQQASVSGATEPVNLVAPANGDGALARLRRVQRAPALRAGAWPGCPTNSPSCSSSLSQEGARGLEAVR
jgi:SAM-dependent methyltransferase